MLASALPSRAAFPLFLTPQSSGAFHTDTRFVQDVRVNHRRAHILVTEKFLPRKNGTHAANGFLSR
jgi:hypothetical protein